MESNQDLFISHSSADSKLAYAMCDYLEKKGIRCWIAPRDVNGGTDYAEAIIMGIRSCKIMVVLFNKNANDSIYVKNEVERAFNYKSILIPFKVDQTIPSATLELFLGSVHSIDATKGNPEDCFGLLYQNCARVLGKKERVIEEKPVISINTETKESPVNEIPVQHQEGNKSQGDKENEIEKKKLGVFKTFLYTSIFISILTIPVIGEVVENCQDIESNAYLGIVLLLGFLLLAIQFIIFSFDFVRDVLKRLSKKPTDSIHLIIYFFALFLGFIWLFINISVRENEHCFSIKYGLTLALIIASAINYWKIIILQRK